MSDNTKAQSQDRSLEFLIVRSTDRYLSVSERQCHTQNLLVKMDEQMEAPEFVFRLLSHKLLSPDQQEAENALTVIGELVARGGNKVAREIGKFKFLNVFIRLLSPKYQGEQTSASLRQHVIQLLFLWRESLRAQTKIGEVYDLLRTQGIIESDPQPCKNRAPIPSARSSSSTRLASFEDAEKARILSTLLQSKHTDDLQAANRMIKSMVRTEDQKTAKFHKRKEVLRAAASRAELLFSMLQSARNARAIFDNEVQSVDEDGSGVSAHEFATMKELYEAILAFRPMLFRYASEAAAAHEEATNGHVEHEDDDTLAQILALNDHVNVVAQLFQERFGRALERANSSEEERIGRQNLQEVDSSQLLSFESSILNGSQEEAPGCSIKALKSYSRTDEDVAILCSPAPTRRQCQKQQLTQEYENEKQQQFDKNDKNETTKTTTTQNNNALADVMPIKVMESRTISQELLDLNLCDSTAFQNMSIDKEPALISEAKDEFLLSDVFVGVEDLEISMHVEPTVFMQRDQLQAILYYATPKITSPTQPSSSTFASAPTLTSEVAQRQLKKSSASATGLKNLHYTIAAISSTNPAPISDVTLKMHATDTLVSSRLLEPFVAEVLSASAASENCGRRINFAGFRPGVPIETVSRVFLVLPLVHQRTQVGTIVVVKAIQKPSQLISKRFVCARKFIKLKKISVIKTFCTIIKIWRYFEISLTSQILSFFYSVAVCT